MFSRRQHEIIILKMQVYSLQAAGGTGHSLLFSPHRRGVKQFSILCVVRTKGRLMNLEPLH